MIKSLQLKVKKRSQPQLVLRVAILLSVFYYFLIDVFFAPPAIRYVIDVMVVFALVLAAINISNARTKIPTDAKAMFWWIIAFFVICAIVYVANFQSPLYFAWGVRNNFRYYVFLFACILFLNKQDIDEYLKLFDNLFYANTAVCFIQFFFFDLRGDFLGGFFGTAKGCNGYLNIFLVVVSIKTIVFYLHKMENIWLCILKCSLALGVAALAELKFFFVEFIVIVLFGVFFAEMSVRKLSITFIGVAIVVAASTLLSIIFPHFTNFLSFSSLIESASTGGYSSMGQLNRLTTIPVLSEKILVEWPERIFGLGLGNCENSNFEILKTPFFMNYYYLRYNWFLTAFLYLETGIIGLVFYFAFFFMVGYKSYKISKKYPESKLYCNISLISAILCILIAIYNSSLRTEAGYIIYFFLTIPFIIQKEDELSE